MCHGFDPRACKPFASAWPLPPAVAMPRRCPTAPNETQTLGLEGTPFQMFLPRGNQGETQGKAKGNQETKENRRETQGNPKKTKGKLKKNQRETKGKQTFRVEGGRRNFKTCPR